MYRQIFSEHKQHVTIPRTLFFIALAVMTWMLSPTQAAWACGGANPTVLCVDVDATPSAPDGLSWTEAFTNVQDALDYTNTYYTITYEIWVAEGVYYPDVDGDGDHTDDSESEYFTLSYNNVQIYGGFDGTETARAQRDWETHLTVLSGDLQQDDTDPDGDDVIITTTHIITPNADHVLYLDGVTNEIITETTVIDGFTVTAGQADGSSPHDTGGGLYCRGDGAGNECSPVLTNIIFSGNQASNGGGMHNQGYGGLSSPVLTNVSFMGNQASYGGGMYNNGSFGDSSPTLTAVTFSGNQASELGGGMYSTGYTGISNPALTNVTFEDNQAGNLGGGMHNYGREGDCSPVLTNVIFRGNQASEGGGMYNDAYKGDSNPTLTNVIFSGNYASTYGGGLFNHGNDGNSSPTLTNVTFSGNWASDRGGGMYNVGINGDGSPALTNVILWGNVSNNGNQMYNLGSNANPVLSYTLVLTDSANVVAGIITYTNIITADPQFVAPITATAAPTTTGDYRLQASSPAIDAGDNSAVTVATDLDGNPRIVSGTVDLGAYEVQPALGISKSVTPTTDVGYHGTVTYTIVLSNSSVGKDTSLFTDTLPPEVDFATWVISPTNTSLSNDEITWSGTVTAGEAITWTWTVTHTGTYGDSVTNTAMFSSTTQTGADAATFTVQGAPDLGILKTVAPGSALPGDTITYTLTFSNMGEATATGVVITDSIPVSVTNMSFSSTGASITERGGDPYIWDVADLAQGAGGIITITGQLSSPLASGTFINAAIISTPLMDIDPANNTAVASVLVQNAAPVAASDTYTTAEEVPLVVSAPGVLANDSDANGDTVSAVLDTDVSPGTLALESDGSFIYTPTLDFDGVVTFSYHTNDTISDSNTALVTLTVTNVNDPPSFASTAVPTATESITYTYTVVATDPDGGDVVTITSQMTLPMWLSLSATVSGTATLAGTPGAGDVGTHTVSLLVTDSGNLTDTQDFAIVVAAAPSQPPVVQSISPPANATMVPVTTDISVTYDQAMDATTVNGQTFAVYGAQSGRISGSYSVNGNTIILTPAQPFKPGEWVQANVTTGTLSLAGTTPLTPTVWQFRTSVSAGSGTFMDTGQALNNMDTVGAGLGDVDGDGDLDVLAVNGGAYGHTKIWLNDGSGMLTDSGQDLLSAPSGIFGDFDGDGDPDVVLGGYGVVDEIWLNDGTGFYTQIGTMGGNGRTYGLDVGDVDGDGDLDVAAAIEGMNTIYLNDGNANFTIGSSLGGGESDEVRLGDLDGDGDLDAIIGLWNVPNPIYLNDGQGNFSDSGLTMGGLQYVFELGDLDGDGDLDAFVGNRFGGLEGNAVWLNDGTGVFTDNGQTLGSGEVWISDLGDVDGDGDLDAFSSNRGGANEVWINDGTGAFASSGQVMPSDMTQIVRLGDLNGDGALDAFVANGGPNRVWLNDITPPNTSPSFTSTPIMTATEGMAYTYNVTANDAAIGVLTMTAPTLPAWLHLTQTIGISGTALATLAGTPGASEMGTHTVSLLVTDSDGLTDTQNFAIVVSAAQPTNQAPSFTSAPVITATEDAVYTYAVRANDADGDALTITATTLPSWLTLRDNGNGTASLSGAPDDPEVGEHIVALQVADAVGATDTQVFNITVIGVNDAPQFTSTPVTTGTVDAPYSYVITVSDADNNDTAVISAPTLPGWLTLTTPPTGTPVLAGTPDAAQAGEHEVSLRVTDGAGATATQNFTLLVLGSGPVVLNTNDDGAGSLRQIITDATAGETVTFDPSLKGATITLSRMLVVDKNLTIHAAAPITVSGGGTVGMFTVNNGANVTINGLTFADGKVAYNGVIDIAAAALTLNDCTVRDNVGGAAAVFLGFQDGGALTINRCTFLNNKLNDNTGGGVAVTSFHPTEAVIINNSTFVGNDAGKIGFVILAAGPLELTHNTFSGNLGAAHVLAASQLSIRNTVMTGDSVDYQCYAQTLVESTGNIINGPSTCGGTEVDPQLGALADNGGATWTQAVTWGSPALNAADSAYCLPVDQRGQTRPQDGACDAGAYEATLNNKPPSFTSVPITAAEQDSEYRYTVTALDPNVQDVLVFSAPVQPDWLRLLDNSDGTAVLVGTPGVPDIGVQTVTLVVADGLGISTTQHFSITVAPRPPVTLTTTLTGNGSGSVTSTPAGIDCGATCAARFDFGSTVLLTAQPETGSVFAGWDNCDAPAASKCTMTANAAKMVNARFVVQNDDNYPPTAINDSAQTTSGEAVVIQVLGNDWDADGLDTGSVVIVTAPANGTATVNSDGSVRYTPNADFKGTDSFNYTVNDTEGATSNAAVVEIDVARAGDVTVPNALVFHMVAGTSPEAQRLTVQGIKSKLSWSYTSWLDRINKQWGPWQNDGKTYLIDFSVKSTLGVGTHYGTIKVWRDGQSSVPVPVTVIVTERPELMLSKTRLGFSGMQNLAAPPTQTIKLSHAGATPFNWTARANADWIVLTPANGTTPVDLQVAIDPAQMANVGEHTAKVFVNDGTQDHEINVTLNVVAPDSEPLALTGLEVTQVIQNLNNDIALVANKTTIVRAHVQNRVGDTAGNVTAKLSGYRDNVLLGTLAPSSDGGTVNVPHKPDRANLDDSFYFKLPPEWTTGDVTLVFSGENQAVACQEHAGTPEDCAVTVSFQPMPALPIKLIDVELNLDGKLYKPDQHDRDITIRDFIALYPISEVDVSYGLPLKYTSSDNAQVLYDTRKVRKAAGDNNTLYASLIGKRVGGIAFRPGLDSVSSVDTLLPHKYTEAHEVGHNMGFLHVAACANPAHIDPDYPHPDGRISGALVGDEAIYGLDTQYMRVLGPESKDTMTYCRYRWWSDYHYNQLLEQVPSRFGTRATRAPQGPLVARADEHVILVSGIVTSAEASGNIASVLAITTANDIAAPDFGNYTLRLETRDGTLLTEQSFSPDGFVNQDEGQAGEGFSLALPYFADAARIVLRYGEQTLATREASLNRPTVNVLAPNGGETVADDRLIISWEALDDDGDPLSYLVEYSVDAGVTWETVAPSWPATNIVLDVADLPGSDQVLIQVAANDGFYTAWDRSDAVFTVNDNPPIASIRTPEGDEFYVSGQQIVLQGTGTDKEDGALNGTNLTWYSDRHADPLGTGKTLTFIAEDLAEGAHTLTLVATDSAGQRSDAAQTEDARSDATATEAPSDKVRIYIYRDRPLIPAKLAISQDAINLVTRLGSREIVTQAVTVRNGGDGAAIAWEATVNGDLSVQLDANAGATPDTIVVSLDPATLSAEGIFTGVITLAPAATEDRAINPVEVAYTVDVNAPHPRLNLIKEVETGRQNEVPLSGIVTYTLVISNSGDTAAKDVVLSDLLPPAVTYGAQVSGEMVITPLPGRLLKWGPADIPANTAYTVQFTVVVTNDVTFSGQDVHNTATFTATNHAPDVSNQVTFTIVASSVNNPPDFTSFPPLTGTVGTLYTYNVLATDPNVGDTLAITAPNKPTWLALTDHGDGTATLQGTPTAADSYPVTLQVSDGVLSATQTFSITVAAAPVTNKYIYLPLMLRMQP